MKFIFYISISELDETLNKADVLKNKYPDAEIIVEVRGNLG